MRIVVMVLATLLLAVSVAGCATTETLAAIEATRSLADRTIVAVRAEAELTRATINGDSSERIDTLAAAVAKTSEDLATATVEMTTKIKAAENAESERAGMVTAVASEMKKSAASGDWMGTADNGVWLLLLLMGGSEARKAWRDKKRAEGVS